MVGRTDLIAVTDGWMDSYPLLLLVQFNVSCSFLLKCFCGVFQYFFLPSKQSNKAQLKRGSTICNSL